MNDYKSTSFLLESDNLFWCNSSAKKVSYVEFHLTTFNPPLLHRNDSQCADYFLYIF